MRLYRALVIVVFGAYSQSASAQEASGHLHPYLETLAVRGTASAEGSVRTVDGYELPVSISIDSIGWDSKDFEVQPVTLKLVVPKGPIIFGDVELPTPRAFYMMTTELSNAQAAAFGPYENYDYFVVDEGFLARLNFELDGHQLAWIAEHLQQPDLPVLRQSLGSAGEIAENASKEWRVLARVPTLAEWCAALVDAGVDPCGGNLDWDTIQWKESWVDTDQLPVLSASIAEGHSGLQHLLGNAAELVKPTDEEARRLNAKLQPLRDPDDPDFEFRPWLRFRSEAGLSIGGSVETTGFIVRPRIPEIDKEAFINECCDLQELAWLHQVMERRQWFLEKNWCTGVRFVIELPEGILAQR